MSDSSQRSAEAAPPEPGEVLRAIYKQEGDGSSSYELDGQIWATYWYGHDYEFGGRRYFTGFAYNTVEKPDETDVPAPGDQVAISQATYVRAPEGSVALWEFLSAERDIGEFGSFEKGSSVDEGIMPHSYLTDAGDYLLAVPAWNLESGIRLRTAEIFVLKRGQEHWQYAGSIATGEDNSAGCASDAAEEEGLPPCAISIGKLEFRPQPDVELPAVLVAMKGKVIHSPGMTRNLGSRDVAEYRYDQAVSKYQLVQR